MATAQGVEICQRALVLIGADPLTSFTDDTREALVAANLYEAHVRAVLVSYPWRTAMAQAELNRLTAEPVSRWDAAYQLPSDCLLLRAITVLDLPIPYDRYGENLVYCNASEDDTVVADYLYRSDETVWSPAFTLALTYDLAQLFSTAIAEDAKKGELFAQLAQLAWAKARAVEAQAQTAKKAYRSRLMSYRRG